MKGRPEKLFNKVVFIHLVTVCVLIFLLMAIITVIQYRNYTAEKLRSARLVGEHLSIAGVDPIVQTLAYDRLPETIEKILAGTPHVEYIAVYSFQGEMIVSGGKAEDREMSFENLKRYYGSDRNPFIPVWLEGREELIIPLKNKLEVIGAARIVLSNEHVRRQILYSVLLVSGVAFILLAISILIYLLFLNRKLGIPLAVATSLMDEYGKNPDKKIIEKVDVLIKDQRDNEIGLMMKTFSNMIERVETSNEKLKTMAFMVESASSPIVMFDLGGIVTYVNSAFIKTWGYGKKGDVVGRDVTQFCVTDECVEAIIDSIQSEKIVFEEKKARRRDGTLFDIQISAATVRDHDGTPIALMASFVDISERKIALRNLEESEKKHRRLVENLGKEYFFYVHDTEGVFSYVSPSIKAMLGYESDEFMEHYSKYLTDNPINEEVMRKTSESIDGIKNPPYQVEIFNKSGDRRLMEVTEVPIFDSDGNVRSIEGIAHDITLQKESENALKSAQNYISSIIDSMPSVLVGVDTDLRITQWNNRAEQITGIGRDEVMGKMISELFPEMQSETEKIRESIHRGK